MSQAHLTQLVHVQRMSRTPLAMANDQLIVASDMYGDHISCSASTTMHGNALSPSIHPDGTYILEPSSVNLDGTLGFCRLAGYNSTAGVEEVQVSTAWQ